MKTNVLVIKKLIPQKDNSDKVSWIIESPSKVGWQP